MKRAISAVAVLAALAGGCSAAPKTITIGAVYPVHGSQAEGGREELRGVRLAVERINREGGIGGRSVRLEFHAADTAEAAPEAVEAVARAGAPVILGSYASTISRQAAATAARLHRVFWETGAVGLLDERAAPGKWTFRFAVSGAALGKTAVSFARDEAPAAKALGRPLRVAVTFVDDVYGRAVGLGAVDEAEKSGQEVVATLPYPVPGADYDDIARRVRDAKADVLVVVAYLEDGVAIRRSVLSQHVPLAVNIGTSSSYCHPAFGEALGQDAVGVFASDKPDGDVLDPARLTPEAASLLTRARDTYRATYGQPMPAAALSGFSGAWALLRHVLPRAKGLDAPAISRAAVDVRLPSGSLPNGSGLELARAGSRSPGGNLRAASVVWEWVRPRERAVVWPPAFATQPIPQLS